MDSLTLSKHNVRELRVYCDETMGGACKPATLYKTIVFLLTLFLIGNIAFSASAATFGPSKDSNDYILNLRLTCGAIGDGQNDDGGALHICLDKIQAQLDQGWPAILKIPAGVYLIGRAAGRLPTLHGGAAIIGDGPHQSRLLLDRDFQGDLFSWSEAWTARNYGPPGYDVRQDKTGAEVIGLQVTGWTDAPNEQNALVFYDRNDNVLVRDIEVDYLNGACLIVGRQNSMPEAYMREALFSNFRCFSAGTKSQAAVEISSFTELGSDATNELDFFKLAIFGSASTGLSVRNPNFASATRKVRFFGLRVEQSGADCLEIGHDGDLGVIAEINIYNFTAIQCAGAAFHLNTAPLSAQPYQISVKGGSIGPGNSSGVVIRAGWNVDISVSHIDAVVSVPPNALSSHITVTHDGN